MLQRVTNGYFLPRLLKVDNTKKNPSSQYNIFFRLELKTLQKKLYPPYTHHFIGFQNSFCQI